MKTKPASVKKQPVTLKDLKTIKNPRGGAASTTMVGGSGTGTIFGGSSGGKTFTAGPGHR
jgi:hypothetical protein